MITTTYDNYLLESTTQTDLSSFETFVNTIDTDSILDSIDELCENKVVTNEKIEYGCDPESLALNTGSVYKAKFNLCIMLGYSAKDSHINAVELIQYFLPVKDIKTWL